MARPGSKEHGARGLGGERVAQTTMPAFGGRKAAKAHVAGATIVFILGCCAVARYIAAMWTAASLALRVFFHRLERLAFEHTRKLRFLVRARLTALIAMRASGAQV